jgi:hypothetical protein
VGLAEGPARPATSSRRRTLGPARCVLFAGRMDADERWTIPFHILIWTTLLLGLIAVMVIVMLN